MAMTTHRRGYKKGDYLIVDERTGETVYASQAVREKETGLIVHKGNVDPVHPSLKVRPLRNDPKPVTPVIPQPSLALTDADRLICGTIGDTGRQIPQSIGASQHLFSSGIGCMVVEANNEFVRFRVRAG